MNKEINYSMIIVGSAISKLNFSTAVALQTKLNEGNEPVISVTQWSDNYSVVIERKDKDTEFFSIIVPKTFPDETELLTFIADKVELLLGTLFDEVTTFNLESLSYYND